MSRLVSIVLLILPIISRTSGWAYENMPKWPRNNRYCAGHLQSPIDLRFNESYYDQRLKPMYFQDRYPQEQPELINQGFTVQLNLKSQYILKQLTPWSEDYNVEQLHFHWSHLHDDVNGSEHTVEGQHYPLEMHVVTYSSTFNNIVEAMGNVRGLAVVGFFFQLTPDPNQLLQPLVDALYHVGRQGARYHPSHEFNLKALIGEQRLQRYYRYDGSLTTPPCYESVLWSVVQEPILLSSEQLRAFRSLFNDKQKLIENIYRPVQPLGSRKVYRSFQHQDRAEEAREKLFNEKSTGLTVSIQYPSIIITFGFLILFFY